MSPEFKIISERNKKNRAKNTTKHTCGSVAFVEIAEKTKNVVTGEKLKADELWLLQHTKKNDKGEQFLASHGGELTTSSRPMVAGGWTPDPSRGKMGNKKLFLI
ncbi:hypothetical protein M5689_011242 [Euphorbia peplus]|nr:hypothetical protein M5689_011242 [Euphorbia peplus]